MQTTHNLSATRNGCTDIVPIQSSLQEVRNSKKSIDFDRMLFSSTCSMLMSLGTECANAKTFTSGDNNTIFF